ncbi:MAG: hypothetical protein KJN99_07930 [Marinicaulis sp.]|nr:hypothetical protein [Marinicaulis sp.]
MILRRITEHVKAQNWFAVFLDFCIVVIGVFIGIQVANWNAARADHDLADRYVMQLADDIRSDINDIETGIRTSEWRYAALSTLLENAGLPQPDSIANPERKILLPAATFESAHGAALISAAYYTRFLDSDRPAYSSLVSAGNANLLDKIPSFQCVLAYYAAHDETRKFEDRLLLFRTDFVRAQHDAGVSFAGNLTELEIIEKIKSNEALAATMASYRVFSYFQINVLESLHKLAEDLLVILETNGAECGNSEAPEL